MDREAYSYHIGQIDAHTHAAQKIHSLFGLPVLLYELTLAVCNALVLIADAIVALEEATRARRM
jgi:hypothetical protein